MRFDEAYQTFIDSHLNLRTGERRRKLEEGHGYAEKLFLQQVWWPLFLNFQYIHPEYEVKDFSGASRYLDFAYIRPSVRLCFEIDGYGPHLKNISRWQFSDNLDRQNQLIVDGWKIIRFSYDIVKDNPRRCQQIIGKILGDELIDLPLTVYEKEVLRIAIRNGEVVSPREIQTQLEISDKTAKKLLVQLVTKNMLIPISGIQRIRLYKLTDYVKAILNK